MILRWRGDQPLADREAVAAVYEVSPRSVRRYCTPCDYDPVSRRALYDLLACEHVLAGVTGRPNTTVQARLLAVRRREALPYLMPTPRTP